MTYKERIEKILLKEKERLTAKYTEAVANYNDTGYQRYYTQMEKCEAELEEIETMIHYKLEMARADRSATRYRTAIANYRKKVSDYALYHKNMDRPVEETVKALELKLLVCLQEAGL